MKVASSSFLFLIVSLRLLLERYKTESIIIIIIIAIIMIAIIMIVIISLVIVIAMVIIRITTIIFLLPRVLLRFLLSHYPQLLM
jgi:hypothetical protein